METQVHDIATLNDRFRGMCLDVFYTSGVRDGIMDLIGLSRAVENFNSFNEDNDPHGEHVKLPFSRTPCLSLLAP